MAASEYIAPRYGGWGRPDRGGLGNMNTAATVLLVLGPMVAVGVFIVASWLVTLIYLAVWGALMLALAVRDRHQRTILHTAGAVAGYTRARATRATMYRSGPVSRIPLGRHMLPGLLASSELSEHTDSHGRAFAIIRYPSTRHYAVVIGCEPDGMSLVDHHTIDHRVAQWGHWLAALAGEPGLHAASVTVETTPDSGARLRREVSSSLAQDAPDLARAVYQEIMDTYPAGSAQARSWVTLVFRGGNRRRRNASEIAVEVASRLPELTSNLQHVGAGVATPLTAQAVCEIARTAYDPAAGRLLEMAHANQETPVISWDDCGPVATQTAWDHYRHDSGVSRTWAMTGAPRGESYSSVLARLLEPARDVDRKRLTLTYRPYDPARAARTVEQNVDKADFRVTGSRRATSRSRAQLRAAQQSADEEARGAGLVQFDLMVTATVSDVEALPDASAVIDSLAASARLQLRPVYGSQDSAFAAALPLGVIPADHSSVAASARESL